MLHDIHDATRFQPCRKAFLRIFQLCAASTFRLPYSWKVILLQALPLKGNRTTQHIYICRSSHERLMSRVWMFNATGVLSSHALALCRQKQIMTGLDHLQGGHQGYAFSEHPGELDSIACAIHRVTPRLHHCHSISVLRSVVWNLVNPIFMQCSAEKRAQLGTSSGPSEFKLTTLSFFHVPVRPVFAAEETVECRLRSATGTIPSAGPDFRTARCNPRPPRGCNCFCSSDALDLHHHTSSPLMTWGILSTIDAGMG